ncbi:MAG: PQQ-binding-like beta-propeller repeat protein [Chloroflexia bacterium]
MRAVHKAGELLLAFVLLLGLGLVASGGAGAAPKPPRPAAASDWPMYGAGPTHGSYVAADPVLNPGNVASLAQRWQHQIGAGSIWPSAAPVVVNGRLYAGGGYDSGPNYSGPNYFAFDAMQGTQLWSADVGHPPITPCLTVGIGATAAISGGIMVVGGGDAAYYGLNTSTGAILWRHPMNAGPSAFAWSSPVIKGNHVYIGIASSCDDPQIRGEIRMLDLTTGVQLANAYFVPPGHTGGSIWHSPALSADGTTLAVTTGEDQGNTNDPYTRAMVTLDADTLAITGADQEGASGQDLDEASSPTIFSDGQGRELVAASHKDGYIYGYLLNSVGLGPLWAVPGRPVIGLVPAYDPSVGSGGTLIYGTYDGILHAIDPVSGGRRWASVPLGLAQGNLAITNGLVFENTGAHGLQILDESTGALLRTLDPLGADDANSGLAISNGFVYWISGNYLNAWSLPGSPLTPPPPTRTPTPIGGCAFLDVCPSDYFYNAVSYLKAQGAVTGYQDNTFRPYTTTARGQLVKILVIAFHITPFTGHPQTFTDVDANNPFYSFVETASKENIVSGYTCGGPGEPCDSLNRPYFRTYNSVTRAQTAKMSAAAGGWSGFNPSKPTFADVPTNDPFYGIIEAAACHGVISGYTCGGPGEPCDTQNRPYFRPGGNSTRGQVCKMVYNALNSPGCMLTYP